MKLCAVDYVIFAFGGASAAAEAIGVSRQAVSQWRTFGAIPGRSKDAVLEAAKKMNVDITTDDVFYGREVPDELFEP